MNNPFDHLRIKREAEEAERQKLEEAQRLAQKQIQDRQDQLLTYLVDLVKQYSPIVKEVLEQLRAAQYPDLSLRIFGQDTPYPNWAIGSIRGVSHYDGVEDEWVSDVKVSMPMDEKGHTEFRCEFGSIVKTCELSKAELIDTLLEFYKNL